MRLIIEHTGERAGQRAARRIANRIREHQAHTDWSFMPDGTIRQIYFYSVDISEFAVNKLSDRGSLSARGIVTNVQDFIVHLSKELIQP